MNASIIIGIGIAVVFVIVLLAILVLLIFQIRKIQGKSDSLSISLQNLSEQIQQGENNTNILIERISNLQQNQQLATQAVGKVNTDLVNAEKTITSEVGSVRKDSTNTLYQVGKGLSDEISRIRQELTDEVNAVRKTRQTLCTRLVKAYRMRLQKFNRNWLFYKLTQRRDKKLSRRRRSRSADLKLLLLAHNLKVQLGKT